MEGRHMTVVSHDTDLTVAAERCLTALEQALSVSDKDALDGLFAEEAFYRDAVAFTWNLRQVYGRAAIVDLLCAVAADIQPSKFSLDQTWGAPALIPEMEPAVFEVIFRFETGSGAGIGRATLLADGAGSRTPLATLLYTELVELKEA